VEGLSQQTPAHPSIANCSRSLNHTEMLRIASREQLPTPGERRYISGHLLTPGLPPSLFQCCLVAPCLASLLSQHGLLCLPSPLQSFGWLS